jgi:thiol-disulfide isomerase/thioredoxin
MRFLTFFISILLFTSCQQKTESQNNVSGDAPEVLNGIRLYYKMLVENGKTVTLDTSIVMNEKFEFDYIENSTTPEMRFISMDGSDQNLLFLTNEDGVKITIAKDSLAGSKVTGGEANKGLGDYQASKYTFQKSVLTLRDQRNAAMRANDSAKVSELTASWEKEAENFKTDVITVFENNKNNIVGSLVLGELINLKQIDELKGREMFNSLTEDVQNQDISKQIDNYLKKNEVVSIGAKAPEFEGLNPEGEVIKLKEVLGKVTLVDFWASWCGPCRRENPNVVAAYEKYHDKGFNIISVSLDRPTGAEAWKKAIIDDNMNWFHISRLQYFGPLAKLYNVSAIPATFLLDENGVIIDKNLRGQALPDRLGELLD